MGKCKSASFPHFREDRSNTKDEDYLQSLDKQAKVHDLKKYIDPLAYRLYNLTPEEIAIVEGKRGMPSVS